MTRLNHYYRIVGTGVCFICFGIGGLLLSLLVMPLQRLYYRNPQQRKQVARKTVHYCFKGFIGLIRILRIFNFQLTASPLLAQTTGRIIIANHPCLIDVVALIAMTPNADCVVKAQLFRNPFMRGVISNTGYISNSDPIKLMDDCSRSLQAGNNLIIFPEGTRTTPGQSLNFQRGAANIALRAGADYLALYIACQPSTLTKQEKWYHVPVNKPTLRIEFLQEFATTAYQQLDSQPLAARQLSRDLQHFYQQVVNNHGNIAVRT